MNAMKAGVGMDALKAAAAISRELAKPYDEVLNRVLANNATQSSQQNQSLNGHNGKAATVTPATK